MLDKNYLSIYAVLAFLSIGFIILGSVVFKNQEYYSIDSKTSLLRENDKEWKRGPYTNETPHQMKISLFNIKNPRALITNEKIEVMEKENNVNIFEKLEYDELYRKPYQNTEILNLKLKNTRTFEKIAELKELNEDLTLIKTGSFVYWNYVKNSPKGSNLITRLYKQLKEIETKYFLHIKLKAKSKITSFESFKTSTLFNDVLLTDEVKEIMYNKVKMSFIVDTSFEESLLICNDSKKYQTYFKRKETIYTWNSMPQKCLLFKQLFNLSNENFKKMSENYLNFVQNELNIQVDKYQFAREQWGRGKYIDSFFMNNNTHLFGKELHAFDKKIELDQEIVNKLIDYYFVHENDISKEYIASEDKKSLFFDKYFIDSFYKDNTIKFPLIDLSPQQENTLKEYLKSIYNSDFNNDEREIYELSEFFADRLYYFATKLGYELFINILSNKAVSEYFSKKTCLENIDFIENKDELKKICTEFNDLKELKDVNKMLLGILYEKSSVVEFIESTITDKDQRAKFILELKKIYVSYISDINTNYIKDDKLDSKYLINGNYKELNFNKFGLVQFFFSEYPTFSSFKSFYDIDGLKDVSEFTKYCEQVKKENPLKKEKVEQKADFSGYFSIGYISNELKDKKDKSDVFVDYIRELYINLKLSGLTRTISEQNDQQELESGYIDELLKSFNSKSILLGGNKILYDNQYLDSDKFTGDRVSFYSGFNNTAISRFFYSTNGLNLIDSEDNLANKIVYKEMYYPGNNEPLRFSYEKVSDNYVSRSDLNCTDMYKFIPQSNRKNFVSKNLNTQDDCIYIPEIFSKVYLNKTKEIKLATYLNAEEFKLNFTKTYLKSNDNQLIDLSQVFKYGLAASKKYFLDSKEIFNAVNFYKSGSETPLSKEEMDKDDSVESLMTIENTIGLNVKSSLNIMYSLKINKDILFQNEKVIPLYFKKKSFDFSSNDLHNNFSSIRGNSFGFKLFDFIGVGLLLFSIMAIVYIVFKPTEKSEENTQIKYQNSLVSTYGALGEDLEDSKENKNDTYFSNKELLNKTEITKSAESSI